MVQQSFLNAPLPFAVHSLLMLGQGEQLSHWDRRTAIEKTPWARHCANIVPLALHPVGVNGRSSPPGVINALL
jgi:hypothetical protein